MDTLYNITQDEAKQLKAHFGTPDLLGIWLWNTGKVASIERGVQKAIKLFKFAAK